MEIITSDEQLARSGFYWREIDSVRALVCEPLEHAGFINGFSTRGGGVSAMPEHALSLAGFNEDTAENILENRRRFLKLFRGEWVLAGCWQVHGSDVRLVPDVATAKPAEDKYGDTIYCDAIVSDSIGVLAGVKTADCVPILLGDAATGAFAAVHAGWRGTVAGVVTAALKRLQVEYQSGPENVIAAIGPAAASCCYEVGEEVIDAFVRRSANADSLFEPTRPGHAKLDLFRANRQQLVSAGVKDKRIFITPYCTMCRTDLFFSYRREKHMQGKVGRMMAVIGRQ
ncbi:MAG: peptidoglycan editing factor PgeF [Pyrinomonadaceae bacterium]